MAHKKFADTDYDIGPIRSLLLKVLTWIATHIHR